MNTQRWQFNQNKLIGFGALFSLSVFLIAATTMPVTAQTIRSQRTRFGGVYPVPERNTFYNDRFRGSQPVYVNPGYYPNPNYYPYPSPFNRREPLQRQPILVDPSNGVVYQAPGRNTVIYNNSFPGSQPGYINPGYYPNSNPGPVLVNPTIRNSTLINPVIITPRQRWQREDKFVQPARY